jgi:hypothetical protein
MNEYGFLYWTGPNAALQEEGEERYSLVRAKTLRGACGKMVRRFRRLRDIPRCDYEVTHKGEYIDLYELKHAIEEYLP